MEAIRAGSGSLYLCCGVEVMSAYPLHMGEELTGMFARLSRARSIGGLALIRVRFRLLGVGRGLGGGRAC